MDIRGSARYLLGKKDSRRAKKSVSVLTELNFSSLIVGELYGQSRGQAWMSLVFNLTWRDEGGSLRRMCWPPF